MKRFVILVFMVSLMIGCGKSDQQQTASKASTAEKSKDYIQQGFELIKTNDVPRAIQSFDMAIKSDPTNVANYLILGQVYMKLKLYDRGVDTFSAATKVDPTNGEAHFMLATSKALDGRREGAIQSAQKSVELFMQARDEENFKRAVALLKSLTPTPEAPSEVVQ